MNNIYAMHTDFWATIIHENSSMLFQLDDFFF